MAQRSAGRQPDIGDAGAEQYPTIPQSTPSPAYNPTPAAGPQDMARPGPAAPPAPPAPGPGGVG